MKKFLTIFAAVSLLLAGCAKNSDYEDLKDRVDRLGGQQITSVEGQVANISSSVSDLQRIKELIDQKIEALGGTDAALKAESDKLGVAVDDLKTYANGLVSGNRTWAQSTFATLDVMSDVLTRLASLEQKVPSLEQTISGLETNIKNWVGVQLDGYVTLAKLESEMSLLEGRLGSSIGAFRSSFDTAKAQLTKDYQDAIAKAINVHAGQVTEEISSSIKAAFAGLQTSIGSLEASIAALVTKMSDLIGRIQSVTVVPDKADGSVSINPFSSTTVRFEVSPANAAKALVEAKDAKDFFSFQAVEAQTKATQTSSFIDFTVESVAMAANDAFVEVTVSPKSPISDNPLYLARLCIEAYPGEENYVCKTSSYFPFVFNITDLSSEGTANCYIVPASGFYKFKATVMGNSTESVGTPVAAEVLWEANGRSKPNITKAGDMISNMKLSDGYVIFEAPASLTDGNALIAVKDAEGTILWSWHIWICKGYDPVATAQVYYNNAGTFMDRNLGATSGVQGFLDETNDKPSAGLLYQWGRKDPFQSSGNAQQTATLGQLVIVASDASKGTIDYSVKHPTEFISYADNVYHDWIYSGPDNTRWQSTKTKYDPCPNGWRVPDGSVWGTAFGTITEWNSYSSWDTEYLGMNFGKTINRLGEYPVVWYPSAGKIGQTGRSEYTVSGGYWSVTPSSTNGFASGLMLNNTGFVYPAMDLPMAYGFSVRCMAE